MSPLSDPWDGREGPQGAGLALREIDQSRHVPCQLHGQLRGPRPGCLASSGSPSSEGGDESPEDRAGLARRAAGGRAPRVAVATQLPFSALRGAEGPRGSHGPDCPLGAGATWPEAPPRSPARLAPLYLNVCEIPPLLAVPAAAALEGALQKAGPEEPRRHTGTRTAAGRGRAAGGRAAGVRGGAAAIHGPRAPRLARVPGVCANDRKSGGCPAHTRGHALRPQM